MGKTDCPLERTITVIAGKWTLLILRDLLAGTKRFNELRASLRGISPKTLTEKLRLLEQADGPLAPFIAESRCAIIAPKPIARL